jgi:hypothetical protein
MPIGRLFAPRSEQSVPAVHPLFCALQITHSIVIPFRKKAKSVSGHDCGGCSTTFLSQADHAFNFLPFRKKVNPIEQNVLITSQERLFMVLTITVGRQDFCISVQPQIASASGDDRQLFH